MRGYSILGLIDVPPLAVDGEIVYDFHLPEGQGAHLLQVAWTTPDGPASQVVELLQGNTSAFDPALPMPTFEGGAKVYKSGAFPEACVGRPMLRWARVKISRDESGDHNGCFLVVGYCPAV